MPASATPDLSSSAPRNRDAASRAAPAAPARGGELELDEERWHRAPEPAEEPPFCDRCFGYHAWNATCPDGF